MVDDKRSQKEALLSLRGLPNLEKHSKLRCSLLGGVEFELGVAEVH